MAQTTKDRERVSVSNNNKRDNSRWPRTILEAYKRSCGPYNIENADAILDEEPIELYNGWLVWQEMTDLRERRVANNIQVILDLAGRAADFGQAYPDQVECHLANGDDIKPDVCLISWEKASTGVIVSGPNQRLLLQGGPELVVELRSPSNIRKEEQTKRQKYFENGTQIIWDVDPRRHKIWVYEVENRAKPREYKEGDIINCERLLPGWRRTVADFFAERLSAEQMVGQEAQRWRAESRAEGRTEGEALGRAEGELEALRKTLLRLAQHRFRAEQLPADLESRLNNLTLVQLTDLVDSIAVSASLEEWLASFPG